MKKVLAILGIVLVIIVVIFIEKDKLIKDKNEDNKISDVTENIKIGSEELEVTYKEGNLFDEELGYGNKLEKYFEVKNPSDEAINFSINFDEAEISNQKLEYEIYFSTDKEEYNKLDTKTNILKENQNLIYNLGIDGKTTLSFKLVLFAKYDLEATTIKGKLVVSSNLSERELFKTDIYNIQTLLEQKIDKINGINEKGYFIINVKSIPFEDIKNYFGYIVIDANDYSNPKYIYTVYSPKYMLINTPFSTNIKNNNLRVYDKPTVDTITADSACKAHNVKECRAFSELKVTPNGGLKNFSQYANNIASLAKEKLEKETIENKAYVYNIQTVIGYNKNSMRGYVLVDNNNGKKEIYLYITNNIFMISGYNYSKYGDVKINTGTIRAYNELTYNLSSANEKSVCDFTKLNNCVY